MEPKLCKNCGWFRQFYNDPKQAYCYNPGARTDDVDLVFGYTTYYQCDAMRKSTSNQCSREGLWFQPNTLPKFSSAPTVQNSNRERVK